MLRATPVLALFFACLVAVVPAADAQSADDRRVRPDDFGQPIVLKAVDSRTLGAFARAARLPIGMEVAPGDAPVRRKPVTLTGLPVSRAIEILQTFDPRYEWRVMGRVLVLRTPDAWNDAEHPLHRAAPQVALENIRGGNALALAAALLGAPQYRDAQFGDVKRFSLNVEAGTVMDVLNASVEAHGTMAWAFERSAPGRGALFPFMVLMYAGSSGSGCGVPGTPEEPVDVATYADPEPVAVGGSTSILDRLVANDADGRPVTLNGPFPSAVTDLAKATKVPMGIEFLGPGNPPRTAQIVASGRTLRDVLDAMIAVDPRYEWRELEGVLVIRPVAAWNDPESLFFRLTRPVRMNNVLLQTAIELVGRELGHPGNFGNIPQGKRISLDLPQGTVLDLVNAIVRVHGELTWTLSPDDMHPDSKRAGYRYGLTFGVMGGGGMGFAVR